MQQLFSETCSSQTLDDKPAHCTVRIDSFSAVFWLFPQRIQDSNVAVVVWVQVRVVRGGQERTISTYDLLVGDVLLIDTGDILPADGLLFESSNLRCDPRRA